MKDGLRLADGEKIIMDLGGMLRREISLILPMTAVSVKGCLCLPLWIG